MIPMQTMMSSHALLSMVTIPAFFLTLARHVLAWESDVSLSLDTMGNFLTFYNRAPISFGERYQESLNERTPFGGDHSFVQLALPLKYPLRVIPEMEHLTKLAAVLFFFDFCVSVAITHDFHWGKEGNWFEMDYILMPDSSTTFDSRSSNIAHRTASSLAASTTGKAATKHFCGPSDTPFPLTYQNRIFRPSVTSFTHNK